MDYEQTELSGWSCDLPEFKNDCSSAAGRMGIELATSAVTEQKSILAH
jgi:hypothetical protein